MKRTKKEFQWGPLSAYGWLTLGPCIFGLLVMVILGLVLYYLGYLNKNDHFMILPITFGVAALLGMVINYEIIFPYLEKKHPGLKEHISDHAPY